MDLRITHSVITLSLNVNLKMHKISTVYFLWNCLCSESRDKHELFCAQYQFPVPLLFATIWLLGRNIKTNHGVSLSIPDRFH